METTKVNINRQSNFDLLRIIATFAVILIHVNSTISIANNMNWLAGNNLQTFVNTVTRFSVPCFVMISGAFILSNNNNSNFRYFYCKSIYKLGFPLIIFTLIEMSILFVYLFFTNGDLFEPIKRLLCGNVNAYWFMFMLAGLYFLAPIIIRVKKMISKKSYCIGSIFWMIFACISQGTSTYNVSYSFGVVFSFLGYFLLGNVIYENIRNLRFKVSILFIISSIFIFIFVFLLRVYTGFWMYTVDPYINWFSPLIILASVLLFIGFDNIKIIINLSKISSKTYFIYLFHTRVYLILIGIFEMLFPQLTINPELYITIISLLTFFVSFLLSIVYLKIWSILERKFKWKEKLNSKFKLSSYK